MTPTPDPTDLVSALQGVVDASNAVVASLRADDPEFDAEMARLEALAPADRLPALVDLIEAASDEPHIAEFVARMRQLEGGDR